MALADELLDSISEEQSAEYMSVETNPHIVIDEDRNIILPERYKVIAAQGDHDMTTYTFDCPRFSDGRDMSKMVVYINYIRSDGETGSYPADNVSIDAQNNDLMHFEWKPLLPATIEHGAFAFLVCVCRTEPDGSVKNHWSTRLCKDATISEGMDCHKDTIINMYPDVITRILERLNVLEDGGATSVQYTVQDLEEEQKVQARKNIEAADAKEVSKLSEDIATKASAIKEKASGEVIVVTDSDEAKPLGLAIDGKSEQNQYSGNQLFDYTTCKNVAVDGNGNDYELATRMLGDYMLVTSGTYTWSEPSGTIQFINVKKYDLNKSFLGSSETFDKTHSQSFEITEDIYVRLYFMRKDGGNISLDDAKNIMFNKGNTALPLEPYCGGIPSPNQSHTQEIRNIGIYDEASGKYAVEVKGNRKNLYKNSQTFEGFENLKNYDSNYKETYNGLVVKKRTEAYGGAYKLIEVEEGITYTFSAFVKTTVPVSLYADIPNISSAIVDNKKIFYQNLVGEWERLSFTFTVVKSGTVALRVESTQNDDIYICGYQLEFGSVMTDYEPWEETTATALLPQPLRKGDKAYWNGGSKIRVDRYKAIEKLTGLKFNARADRVGNYNAYSKTVLSACKRIASTEKADAFCNVATALDLEKIVGNKNDNTFAICYSSSDATNTLIEFCMKQFKTAEEFQTWFNSADIYVEYPLATPITEEIDIDLGDLSMFYPTTILSNDCNANMEVTYIADTKAYIDKKFAELATAMV